MTHSYWQRAPGLETWRVQRSMVIDYREAFDEWLKLDPLNNPSATPGRAYMPGYKNPNLEEAEQLNIEAWRVGAKHRDDRF